MKYLLEVTEVYRVDSEPEVDQLIEEAKADKRYELSKYGRVYKEQKVKGEVVDSWMRVSLTKRFNAEREPEYGVNIIYEGEE